MSASARTARAPRRGSHAALLVGLLAVSVVLVAAPADAVTSNDAERIEDRFVELVNEERAAAGLERLEVVAQFVRIARGWSAQMAADDELWHNPDLRDQLHGPWRRVGENAGVTSRAGSEVERAEHLHAMFMDSTKHREQILGEFNQFGVGAVIDATGRLWVTVNFVEGPLGEFPLFTDVAGSAHEGAIETAWAQRMAKGCTFERYCPTDDVTRAGLASFLVNAFSDIEPEDGQRFSDVAEAMTHAASINGVADAGLVAGCGDGAFCPHESVTRAQLASIIAAYYNLEPREPDFTDVAETSPHRGAIGAVAHAGILAGCGDDRFCPHAHGDRAQLATLLRNTLR